MTEIAQYIPVALGVFVILWTVLAVPRPPNMSVVEVAKVGVGCGAWVFVAAAFALAVGAFLQRQP